MQIEIVDAYEVRLKKDDKPKGWSLHVYLPEFEMDLRGIRLKKTGTGWHLQMPFLKNYDADEQKTITFPMISFLERDKTKNLISEIKEKAVSFVEKKLQKN